LLSAVLWSAISLVAAGIILVALYRQSVERGFDERLDVFLKTLIAQMVSDDGDSVALREPGNLGEPRFELPLSGWYWMVRSYPVGTVEMSSTSLAGDVLALPEPAASKDGEPSRGAITGPDGEGLRYLERVISLADDSRYLVAVAGNATEIGQEVATFGTRVTATLAVFGLGLVLATLLQVRVGLKPLERMRAALHAIRVGDTQRLEGEFPSEIAPLASELNALIDSNREVVDRARTHVGNLAHALKTPLSVVLNEARAADGPLARKVEEQALLMQAQVNHHLDRARLAAQRRMIGVVTEIAPAVEGLARAMRRIHEMRDLSIEATVAPGLRFRGERQDLEEMLGNLLDNACKWAEGAVDLKVEAIAGGGADRRMARVTVDDDGPGLDPAARQAALERGRRLDESVPGSGLGLAIVSDLAGLYGGRLALDASPAGGLRAVLTLPIL
jgi:signal transduction histidine kinase